jgi:hypothetical protein
VLSKESGDSVPRTPWDFSLWPSPFFRINRATRFSPQPLCFCRNFLVTLGLPSRWLLASKTSTICFKFCAEKIAKLRPLVLGGAEDKIRADAQFAVDYYNHLVKMQLSVPKIEHGHPIGVSAKTQKKVVGMAL